tara:strand:- start:3576 stop:4787 length:1212 start_codon:yes stop_codon:yes gene_type:complete
MNRTDAYPSWLGFIGLYLRIGLLGFGGPQAHMALLRSELVEGRHWSTAEQFDEGLVLCEALPGPASSQMAIYLGWLQRGWRGGLVSGICFLLPGLLIVLLLSELWRSGQSSEFFTTALATVQPVMAAIIWTFAWKLLRDRRERWQRRTALAVGIGVLLNAVLALPLPAGLLLLVAGMARVRLQPANRDNPADDSKQQNKLSGLLIPLPLAMAPWAMTAPGLLAQIFGLFFKTGLLVFGGGLVIIPLLEQQVVQQGWLSAGQFLDGVTIGQITPGPVVLTGAFVGYQAGWVQGGAAMAVTGALVATAGLFAPSFGMILIATPLLQRLRGQPRVRGFLDGVLAGVAGAMAAAALSLSIAALQGGWLMLQVAVFATALWLSLHRSIRPLPLIAGGILVGCVVTLLS